MAVNFEKISFHFLEDTFLPIHQLTEKGDDVQKFSVLQSLPQLLQTESKATVSRLIPKILQELPSSSCEFHVMCSKVFCILIEQKVPVNLLGAVLQGVESWDPIVANTWMDTLVAVIQFLTELQIKSEIIPFTYTKSLLTMPVASRVATCRILGKVAVHKCMHPNDVKRDVLPLVQSLCQDCKPDVRAAICLQLPFVAEGLKNDSTKDSLMVCLVELASDENPNVKSAAVGVIVQMFPYTTADVMKNTILPLVVKVCSSVLNSDDTSVLNISKQYGNLIEGLKPSMSVSDSTWFLNCFKSLAHRGFSGGAMQFRSADTTSNVVCRENSASNLPAVARFVLNALQPQIDILNGIIHDLATDPCYLVRQMVAEKFLQIMTVFGVQCKGLKPDFIRLLRDDSEEVLEKIVPNIAGVLQVMCRYSLISAEVINSNSADVGRALLKCYFELMNGFNWRLISNFLCQLECMPHNMPPDYIHQHFTPVVLTCAVHGKGKPTRTQAARTLLIFLRYNTKEMHRRWLRENIASQLCFSTSSYTRLIYVRLCRNALCLFSERYFKLYFFENLLTLADDPVPNVRLCVVSLFPILRQMISLPADRSLHDKLETIFAKYRNEEKDRDVMQLCQAQAKSTVLKAAEREAHLAEQRRLQEEEDQLYDGKVVSSSPANAAPKRATVRKTGRASVSMEPIAPRTQSQPARSPIIVNTQGNSSAPFLEQNVSIDAGDVKLAMAASKHVNVEDEFPFLNVTDDDKVTLRTRNKRFSSILSTDCLETVHKVINRRSLNLEARCIISKIPISSSLNKNGCNQRDDANVSDKVVSKVNVEYASNSVVVIENSVSHRSSANLPSHLPILKRRALSEIRKPSK